MDPRVEEDEVIVNCRELTRDIERLVAAIQVVDHKLIGKKDGQTYILDAANVLYVDTVDRRVFIYTDNDVFESRLKLYMLEEQLASLDFFRAGKSSIVSLRHIRSLQADIDGRLLVTMDNGERLVVSRQYSKHIKDRLGV